MDSSQVHAQRLRRGRGSMQSPESVRLRVSFVSFVLEASLLRTTPLQCDRSPNSGWVAPADYRGFSRLLSTLLSEPGRGSCIWSASTTITSTSAARQRMPDRAVGYEIVAVPRT